MIEGLASQRGTAQFALRFPQVAYSRLGKSELCVSAAGFGCYRINIGQKIQEQSLSQALLAGINLVDTSSNYADGGSERLVGKVIRELLDKGALSREQVVIVSKAGYLQGENLHLSQERRQKGKPFPELVHLDSELEHCIHPEFLSDQLTRSLSRLGLGQIDVFLLHNPEYFLKWAERDGWSGQDAEREYRRRLAQAFAHLETEVAAGRIGRYGMSSNSLPYPMHHREFTPLEPFLGMETLFQHFEVVQFPMNLFEHGAATTGNQSGSKVLLELCRDQDLGVLINRPLNAIRGSQLMRLADPVSYLPAASPQRGAYENRVAIIRERIAAFEPEWTKASTLSQLALRALRSTSGISSVLVGMRRPEYVRDVMEELARPIESQPRTQSWAAMGGIWD